MPISNIDQTISTIPAAGHRGVDVQTIFVNKQEDFQDHLSGTLVDELNTLRTQINTTSGQMNTAVTAVSTSQTNAANSATNAANSATSASTSATNASTSATNAANSATSAANSATNAANSATSASTSATTATTKAGEASTSATNAANSATTATTKAGEAATSATNAANSATSASNDLASIEGILATLPNGSVNDTLIGTDKAYSNQTLQQVIGNINSPLLDLDFSSGINMKAGKGGVTFSRASTGTYIDKYGVLKTASIDEPRFEKDGLLLEGGSTNLLTYSENLTQSVWVKTNTTVSLSTELFIDNINYFYRIDATSASATCTEHYTSAPIGTYTWSAFLKKGNCDTIAIAIIGGGVTFDQIKYKFSTKTFTLSNNSSTAAYSFVDLGNDTIRLSITVTTTSIATITARIYPLGNDTQTTGYCYATACQLEALPFATSYIPTTSASVTRSADTCLPTYYNNIPNIFNPFTLRVKLKTFLGGTSNYGTVLRAQINGGVLLVQTSHPQNTVRMYLEDSNPCSAYFPDGQVDSSIVFVYTGSKILSYIDGKFYTSINSSTSKRSLSDIGMNLIYGNVDNLEVWDKALTATEIALLG